MLYQPQKNIHKINNRLQKIRLQPIEVFLFHDVSDRFNPQTSLRQDWTSTQQFKQLILQFKTQYQFIPLTQAYLKLNQNYFRTRKYAVLTSDDGFQSNLEILQFLQQQQIPVTLFINPQYLDGKTIRSNYAPAPLYLTQQQLFNINSPLVTIGMHNFGHVDATQQSPDEFKQSVAQCIEILSHHPRYIPYFAYPWGSYNDSTQQILNQNHIIPLFCDGNTNYTYQGGISRKPIDSYYLTPKC